ncbi:MAG: serine phosphatase [uncultured bacterium]|nr:MAG: serine phosphatase [uncultured bacterium]
MRTDPGISVTRVYLSIFFIAFVMPVIVFSAGYRYLNRAELEMEETRLLSQFEPAAAVLDASLNNGSFWCRQLNEIFASGATVKEFETGVAALSGKYNQKLRYVVWQSSSSAIISNFPVDDKHAIWLEAGQIIRGLYNTPGGKIRLQDDFLFKKLIGPHLQGQRFYETFKLIGPRILESDFTMKHPLVWVNCRKEYSVLVLLPPAILGKSHGIRTFFEQFFPDGKSQDEYVLTSGKNRYTNSSLADSEIQYLQNRFLTTGKKILSYRQGLVFGEQLSEGCFFMVVRAVKSSQNTKAEGLFALSLFYFFLIIARTFSVTRLSGGLKVNTSIYTFIGLSNILPLCLLILFTSQYLAQKYLVLIDAKRAESVRFAQLLEQQFQNDIERFPGRVKTVIDSFRNELKQHSLTPEIAEKIYDRLVEGHIFFHFIASSSRQVLTDRGFYSGNHFIPLETTNNKLVLPRMDDLVMKIGSCFVAFCNRTPISQNALTETELVADTLFRKPVDEAMHIFVELNGKIGPLGFGIDSRHSFTDLLSVHSPDLGDYLGIYQYDAGKNAMDFMAGTKRERLANSFGLKVISFRGETVNYEGIASFSGLHEIPRVFARMTEYPPLSAEIIRLDGRDWVCSGYKSSVVNGHGLLALYPVDEIKHRLQGERNDLIILFSLNLLIVFAVSFFFSQMLLGPVKWLEEGTRAISSRDFTYRLPDLGNDEMGRMARIFNEAVADLEELSVARVVQQQLQPQGKIDTGGFDMFGRSITLADLGGDYLDYFESDAENFAAILGDVAGHGVGAAMIMAMAKSAILNSVDYFKTPALLVARLNQLIYSTKTRKQKKIMTFQYLMLNKQALSATYANAGGCTPFLVNGKTGKVSELVLPGAVLGAFKKGDFREMEISFVPGDALVLYSDGIVEARNLAGEEIGYERFKSMLLKNWSADSEQYYNSMVAEYQHWLGGGEPQDDMTMLIICLRGRNG